MTRCSFRHALPLGAACLAAALWSYPGVAQAMGSLLPLSESQHAECRLDTLTGEFSDQEHRYKGTGRCDIYNVAMGHPSGPSRDLLETRAWRLDARWTRATGRTSERFDFPRVQTHKYAKWGELQVVMQCRGDPWLGTTGTTPAIWCQSPQFLASGPVELVRDVLQKAKPRLPYTAETLDPALRQRLRGEIQRQRQVESAYMGTRQDALQEGVTRSGATVEPPTPATTLAQARRAGSMTSNATAAQMPGSTLTQARTAGSTTSRAAAPQPTTQVPLPNLADLSRGPPGGMTAGGLQGGSLDSTTAVGQRQVTSDVPARHATAASGTPTLTQARIAAAASPAMASLRVVAAQAQQGRLWLQVRPGQGAPPGNVEVELRPVPAARARADAVRFSAPIDRLAAGMTVPAGVSPKVPGRWQVRVRVSGSAAWSDAVAFDYATSPGRQAADRVAPGDAQALNPQRLPPRDNPVAAALGRRGLNPQPLPPREKAKAGSALQRDSSGARSELGSALQRRVAP
jgi:hypothetical protein